MRTTIDKLEDGTSPGRAFARAYAVDGTRAAVAFSKTISTLFPGFGHRPRLAVRNLFKIAATDREQATHWFESRPASAPTAAVHEIALRPEAGFDFGFGFEPLKPVRAWVQVAPQLLDDLDALAAFVDYRLLVRAATAENQALTAGPGGDSVRGLLATPGIRRLPAQRDPIASLLSACEEVEQMGGSADGAIVNPYDFYRYFVGRNGLLGELKDLGVRIARTRMVQRGSVIVGDFTAGATLVDGGRSSIRFAEPPAGTFPREGLAVCGEIRQALVVHLPTHFFVASLGEERRTDG